jgi:hypothetical protein
MNAIIEHWRDQQVVNFKGPKPVRDSDIIVEEYTYKVNEMFKPLFQEIVNYDGYFTTLDDKLSSDRFVLKNSTHVWNDYSLQTKDKVLAMKQFKEAFQLHTKELDNAEDFKCKTSAENTCRTYANSGCSTYNLEYAECPAGKGEMKHKF